MTLGPKSFPSLLSQKQRMKHGYTRRPYHICAVCRLTVEPRNSQRHYRACAKRKSQDPALWNLWRMDMHGYDTKYIRATLPPLYRQELVLRGYLVHGPLDRRGRFSGEAA